MMLESAIRSQWTRVARIARVNQQRCQSTAAPQRVPLPNAETFGFVGLGAMGFHMASNLVRNGQLKRLVVYDAEPAAVQRLQKALKGTAEIVAVASPAHVAAKAGTLVTMLPQGRHVRDVYLGAGGVHEGVRPGSLLIDSSTIDVATSRAVAGAMERQPCGNVTMVDAPVSGGTVGAEAATLTFMVGASDATAAVPRVTPVLKNMGKNIVSCGELGTGQAAKICNNMLLGITMIGVAETMNLGKRLGLAPELLTRIVNTSSGRCWSSEANHPVPGVMANVPAGRKYTSGFATRLMLKDMGLAVDAARESSSTILMAGVAQQIYNQVSQTPYTPGSTQDGSMGDRDFGVVYRFLSSRA